MTGPLADDLVARLEAMDAKDTPTFANDLMRETAVEIERLRRELQQMTDRKDAVNEALAKVVEERNRLRQQLRETEKEIRDAVRDAHSEQGWQHRQGDEYGSY